MRFDDNVSFIACNSPYTDKASIGSTGSARNRNRSVDKITAKTQAQIESDDINGDSICIDISGTNLIEAQDEADGKSSSKKMSASEILRSVFFRFTPVDVKMESPKRSESKTNLSVEGLGHDVQNAHTSNVMFKTKSVYVENSSL